MELKPDHEPPKLPDTHTIYNLSSPQLHSWYQRLHASGAIKGATSLMQQSKKGSRPRMEQVEFPQVQKPPMTHKNNAKRSSCSPDADAMHRNSILRTQARYISTPREHRVLTFDGFQPLNNDFSLASFHTFCCRITQVPFQIIPIV